MGNYWKFSIGHATDVHVPHDDRDRDILVYLYKAMHFHDIHMTMIYRDPQPRMHGIDMYRHVDTTVSRISGKEVLTGHSLVK